MKSGVNHSGKVWPAWPAETEKEKAGESFTVRSVLNWLAFVPVMAVLIRDSILSAGVVFPAGVLGVAADGRARRFIIVRESPGVIVMVFCS